jgi:hypothetical protein
MKLLQPIEHIAVENLIVDIKKPIIVQLNSL